MTGPVLLTERMILRLPRLEDFDAYAAHVADPEVTLHLGGPQPRPVAWRGFLQYAGAWALGRPGMFFAFEREGDREGAFVGRVGPWRPEGWPGAEVGWAVSRAWWGRGYAQEAVRASMDFAFDALGWDEVVHCIDPANAASQALARRIGSTVLRRAVLPPPIDRPTEVWGQTRAQWRARLSDRGADRRLVGGAAEA